MRLRLLFNFATSASGSNFVAVPLAGGVCVVNWQWTPCACHVYTYCAVHGVLLMNGKDDLANS